MSCVQGPLAATTNVDLPHVEIEYGGVRIDIKEYFKSRSGGVFILDAPFSPASTKLAEELKESSKDLKTSLGFLGVLSTQDSYVLKAWGKMYGLAKEVTFISDPTFKLISSLGLGKESDYGTRPTPAAVVLEGGKICWMATGPDATPANVRKFCEQFERSEEDQQQ